MNMFLYLCLAFAMLALVGVLVLGIASMIRGGEFNKKYGNRLMQARVILQGVALALFALAYFVSRN
ncbi:MAG: twin transmembrane helix small protein [Alphaproteobacteria bacterium]|nr:twin transmembrane helix small protein [Alphaproteobacteria bacterium]